MIRLVCYNLKETSVYIFSFNQNKNVIINQRS